MGRTMPMGNPSDDPNNHLPYLLLDQACNAAPPPEENISEQTMSFDGPASEFWSPQWGSVSDVSDVFTEGTGSMSVDAEGYTFLDSGSFSTWLLPIVGTELELDVFVPEGQPNPYWLGSVQLFVTIPSAQLLNYFVGHAELTPGGTGWRTLAFTLPNDVHSALLEPHADVRFGIAVNTPHGAPSVLLDNLRFGGTLSLPAPGPTGPLQYDFERGGAWDGQEGAVVSTSNSTDRAYVGFSSLRVDLDGSTEGRVWTVPTASLAAGTTVTYRVYIPSGAPIAAVQPYVADANDNWGHTYNANLPQDGWMTLTATVPADAALPVSELGVKFYLSTPYTGPVYLDAIQW